MAKNTLVLSATGEAIPAGAGTVEAIIVGTHSSGVIRLIDAPSGVSGRVILGDYTLASGAQVIPLGLDYTEGVRFVLVSGTASLQLAYSPSIN